MKKKKIPPMGMLFRNIFFIVLIFICLGLLFGFIEQDGNLFSTENKIQEMSIGELVEDINEGQVKSITVNGNKITGVLTDDTEISSKKEEGITFTETLNDFGVDTAKLGGVELTFKDDNSGWITSFLLMIVAPFVLIFIFFWFFLRKAKTGAAQTFDFTKSKARIMDARNIKDKVTFKDVAGLKEEKEELSEIVDFLKHPNKYLKMGAKIPKGVLLVGPAGCGKTLLAQAVAGESNVPFFSVAGSSFIELFVGVGSSRVRNLFETAKKHQPCLVFIDELDSIGKVRGPSVGGGNEEREQTLNQLLTEMDGFEKNAKIVILGATNRADVLDPALLRPGRFDRKVVVNLPDIKEREAILEIHAKGKPFEKAVKLREVAERTPGFSGADLANVVNEAAIFAAKNGKEKITQNDLLNAIEKVLLGPEKKSRVFSKQEKEITAYHEVGHALVASFSPNAEPVRKISIISRGLAAGYTLQVPETEKNLKRKSDLITDIAVLLGGYLSEKLIYGEVSSGASNDLERASRIARKIVKELGMSKLGPIVFGQKEREIFLGQEGVEEKNYSNEIARKIDEEVESVIAEARSQAEKILVDNREILDKVSKELIKKETLEREEYEKLIK
jgi:cell division protease FtsH